MAKQLDARQAKLKLYEDYFKGEHPLAFATSRFNRRFGDLLKGSNDNWCPLVVSASTERLVIEGFRFGADVDDADQEAWAVFQANFLDSESRMVHTEAVKLGWAYLLIGPAENSPYPRITGEHPSQVIVAHAPGSRRVRMAALKRWEASDGTLRANVYLPDAVYRFRSVSPLATALTDFSAAGWIEDDIPSVVNPLGVVPVVPVRNNPTMLGDGTSDLDPVISTQDTINKLCADLLVASEWGAFRQRWATGVDIPTDPDTGEHLTEQYLPSLGAAWTVADKDARFGDFDATQLDNYIKAIEMHVQHLAAKTRTPPHYLLGQSGAFPSGESLKATETGLVAKVKDKQVEFGEAWEEAMRLAFRLMGDEEKARSTEAATIWRDPESRTEGELVDSLTKMATLGVPKQELWRRWGATPQEIERWTKDLEALPPLDPRPAGAPE